MEIGDWDGRLLEVRSFGTEELKYPLYPPWGKGVRGPQMAMAVMRMEGMD